MCWLLLFLCSSTLLDEILYPRLCYLHLRHCLFWKKHHSWPEYKLLFYIIGFQWTHQTLECMIMVIVEGFEDNLAATYVSAISLKGCQLSDRNTTLVKSIWVEFCLFIKDLCPIEPVSMLFIAMFTIDSFYQVRYAAGLAPLLIHSMLTVSPSSTVSSSTFCNNIVM